MLVLTRPLIVFDIESTGKEPNVDRIVELAILKIFPDGSKQETCLTFNPTIPIPDEAIKVHHITNEMVKDCAIFADCAEEVRAVFEGCDICGFNSNQYDIPMLLAELQRAGFPLDISGINLIDVGNLFKILNPRTLTRAVFDYLEREHEGAHGALADTQATYEVLLAMLKKHADLPLDMPGLALKSNYDKRRGPDLAGKFAYNDKDEIIFTFGKHKDKTLNEVVKTDQGYFSFLLSGPNNPADFIAICKKALAWKPKPKEPPYPDMFNGMGQ